MLAGLASTGLASTGLASTGAVAPVDEPDVGFPVPACVLVTVDMHGGQAAGNT